MTEKNGFAQVLDKIAEGVSRNAKKDDDVLNMLPKPNNQEIGDGIIVWRWHLTSGTVIEAILATRHSNQVNLEKDTYVVNVQFPKSNNCSYSFFDDTAKEIGQALLSAWNWQNVWKLHVGDFLLETLSKEPPQEFDNIEAEAEIIADILDDDDDFAINNAQG